MTRIAVLGGTGYAGRHIIAEAAQRGHTVVSVTRSVAAERVEGATYIEGTILDAPSLVTELEGVEVVVSAVAPRGDMLGLVRPNTAELVAELPPTVRFGVIGGAGGSRIAPGGPRVVEGDFPDEFLAEAMEAIGILEDLQSNVLGHDWFFVHPPLAFGAFRTGERTGNYRTGGDVVVTDETGDSYISGEDLAVAVLDEIENPTHHRAAFTVGY